jgi:hypothetical protein
LYGAYGQSTGSFDGYRVVAESRGAGECVIETEPCDAIMADEVMLPTVTTVMLLRIRMSDNRSS